MIDLLCKNKKDIIVGLNSIGVRAQNNQKTSRINMVINELKKHYPNNEITFNNENNTFDVKKENEQITLKLVKKDDKYSIQKLNQDENTNVSNTNSKGKQYTLSNGKPSSKLFADDDTQRS